jgi:probable rRNA maturation factor
LKVTVNRGPGLHMDTRSLRRACLKALKAEGARQDTLLSLSGVRADEMAGLNARYLGREGPTDVLAFPMEEECAGGFLLGDVVICPEVIEDGKLRYEVEEGRELEYVAAHGVLHLMGYDDGDEDGSTRMDRRLREILGLAGSDSR